MKKQYKSILALLLVFITGCASSNADTAANSKEILEAKNEIESKIETIEESNNISEIATEAADLFEVQFVYESGTDETEIITSESSTENIEEESGTDMEKYKGEKYTFYKAEMSDYIAQSEIGLSKIRSVYEEYYQTEYHGLFLGQVVTLFGSESVTDDNENLISCAVAAEDASGNVIYLEVYYGPSGPAIGGQDGENFEEAAKELEDIIRSTIPVDFECSSVYEDVGVSIRMGTKDGKGFYETDFDEMDFEEMDF